MKQERAETWISRQLKDRIRAHTTQMVCRVISIVIFLSFSTCITSMIPAEAGTVLPRMGAVIEIDQVTPKDPWEDRSSRLQWVLARLQSEGLRIWLLDPKVPAADCEVIYLDGNAFKETLLSLKGKTIGILQSASRKLLGDDSPSRTVQASSRISLTYDETGSRRVVTVAPDLVDCFNDYQAVKALADAILWLAGLPQDTPRIAPFPNGKRSAAIFIVHGEGNPETIEAFQNHFFNGPGALTYVVSEDAVRNYPLVVKSFAKSPSHEVAVHNHAHKQYGTQDKVLSTNVVMHKEALEGHRPRGLVGLYLHYFDDLREALVKHQFAWFLDKDLPYPLNIPAPIDSEPVIDMTESLKPYDGWWRRQDAEALWRQGLNWKRLRSEIAVCSWHDVHMGAEPQPFLEFMHYVEGLSDVWQTTALHFQEFWRNRWRARVEILSNDDRHITLRAVSAPRGLTLMRRRSGKAEVAILTEEGTEESRLEWKPLQPMESPKGPGSLEAKWSPVGSIMPRNGLDSEFALVHPGEEMLRDTTITIPLPGALRHRIGQALPTTMRVSTYGVKGLKFKEIHVESIPKDASVPTSISFKVDILPGQSIRFYRLRFPVPEKPGYPARWKQSLRKRPIMTTIVGAAALIILGLLITRKIVSSRRQRRG